MKRASITITICFALTALFAVPQVSAQSVMRNSEDARSSSPGSSKAETSSVDDTTLKKAARAFPRIRQINLKVQEKLKETSGTQEQREVLDQAHNQETAITRQEGIDPDQYNEIMRKVDSDPSVKAKFAFYLRQAADPSSPM
jgi:TolA-binding protein